MSRQANIEHWLDIFTAQFAASRKSMGISSVAYLSSFRNYCKDNYPTAKMLTNEMVERWCARRESETVLSRNTRIGIIRALIKYGNATGMTDLRVPPCVPYATNTSREYVDDKELNTSAISNCLDEYFGYMYASNKMGASTKDVLRYFNDYCHREYPDAHILTEEMVCGWCTKRESETAQSFNKRISPIRSFLRFTNQRGLTDVSLPEFLPWSKRRYVPHAFTDEELTMFFHETDYLVQHKQVSDRTFECTHLTVPVFFRLLYSTGMRTLEARMLRREDVDLENGIINICTTKGVIEHRVALHESVWNLLKKYDKKMSSIIPHRKAFFPNQYGDFYSRVWESYQFKRIWGKVSGEKARCYDLRSNYAVRNINSWRYTGPDWIDKLLYLSRSMGHKNLSSTCYYYNLVPLFAEQLEEMTETDFDEILPDIPNIDNFIEDEN